MIILARHVYVCISSIPAIKALKPFVNLSNDGSNITVVVVSGTTLLSASSELKFTFPSLI
jgi:hypothetical protein